MLLLQDSIDVPDSSVPIASDAALSVQGRHSCDDSPTSAGNTRPFLRRARVRLVRSQYWLCVQFCWCSHTHLYFLLLSVRTAAIQ